MINKSNYLKAYEYLEECGDKLVSVLGERDFLYNLYIIRDYVNELENKTVYSEDDLK